MALHLHRPNLPFYRPLLRPSRLPPESCTETSSDGETDLLQICFNMKSIVAVMEAAAQMEAAVIVAAMEAAAKMEAAVIVPVMEAAVLVAETAEAATRAARKQRPPTSLMRWRRRWRRRRWRRR